MRKRLLAAVLTAICVLLTSCGTKEPSKNTNIEIQTRDTQNTSKTGDIVAQNNDDNNKSYTSEEIFEFVSFTKAQILEKLGEDYSIVPAGAEGAWKGYRFEDIGLTFVFDDNNPDSKVSWIDCDDNIEIKGAKNGMTFSEVQEKFGEAQIEKTFVELPEYKAYKLDYFFDNAKVTYFSQNNDGSKGYFSIRPNSSIKGDEEAAVIRVEEYLGHIPNGYTLRFDRVENVDNKEFYVIQYYGNVIDDPKTGDSHTETNNWFYVEKDTGTIFNWDLAEDILVPADN